MQEVMDPPVGLTRARPTRLSGERVSEGTSSNLVRMKTVSYLRRLPPGGGGEPTEPDYSQLVLEAYDRLDRAEAARADGQVVSEDDLARLLAEVEALEQLEGEQVQRLLDQGVAGPLDQGDRLLAGADAFLEMYGNDDSSG